MARRKKIDPERLRYLVKAAIPIQNELNRDKEDTLWSILDFLNGDEEPLMKLGMEEREKMSIREVDEIWDAPPLPMDRIEEGVIRPFWNGWKKKEQFMKLLDEHYRKFCFSDDKKDWAAAFAILDIMKDVDAKF